MKRTAKTGMACLLAFSAALTGNLSQAQESMSQESTVKNGAAVKFMQDSPGYKMMMTCPKDAQKAYQSMQIATASYMFGALVDKSQQNEAEERMISIAVNGVLTNATFSMLLHAEAMNSLNSLYVGKPEKRTIKDDMDYFCSEVQKGSEAVEALIRPKLTGSGLPAP